MKVLYCGYGAQFFDPGLVLYIYESPPGYGILGLRLIAWLYFSYACFFTVKHYPEKSKFYYPFYIFYTIWYVRCCRHFTWYTCISKYVNRSFNKSFEKLYKMSLDMQSFYNRLPSPGLVCGLLNVFKDNCGHLWRLLKRYFGGRWFCWCRTSWQQHS